MFFVFTCDFNSCVSEDKARNIIFIVMLKSKVFHRLDYWQSFMSNLIVEMKTSGNE